MVCFLRDMYIINFKKLMFYYIRKIYEMRKLLMIVKRWVFFKDVMILDMK